MTKSAASRDAEVPRSLDTGDPDSGFAGWPGDNFIDSVRKDSATLREALIAQVRSRAASRKLSPAAASRPVDGPLPGDPSVDVDEYFDILGEAAQARNGWKRILRRCAPPESSNAAMDRGRLPPAAGL